MVEPGLQLDLVDLLVQVETIPDSQELELTCYQEEERVVLLLILQTPLVQS